MWKCVTFRNKKGSSLTMFYLLVLIIAYKFCINIGSKKQRRGQRNSEDESKEKALIGIHTSLSIPVAQKSWPEGGIICHCNKGALHVDVKQVKVTLSYKMTQ